MFIPWQLCKRATRCTNGRLDVDSDTGSTLRWGHRIPGLVGTVVVDHVVQTDPSVAPRLDCGQLLVGSTLPPISRVWGTSFWAWDWAALNVKVFVVSIKRGFCPINFLKPTSSGPVISFPQCGVDTHGLEFWVWNSFGFIVLVNPYWYFIHIETILYKTNKTL